MNIAVLAAAGQGRRMGGGSNKAFLPLLSRPMLLRSAQALSASKKIDAMLIVAAPEEEAEVRRILSQDDTLKPWQVVAGGSERQYSIANALKALPGGTDYVAVHDAARPLVLPESVDAVVEAAQRQRAAGLAVPVKDTIKESDAAGCVVATPPRERLWAIQTPQVFEAALLRQAYAQAAAEGFLGTDDASLVERLGVPVHLVQGQYSNLKVTTPEDLVVAEAILQQRGEERQMEWRTGMGYDVHRLVPGRKLILGGVDIPHSLGLDGHSDADVLLHALKDALLGAAGLGDIGRHFPDTEAQYRGISSLLLLEKVQTLLEQAGWVVNNVDVTVAAQRPKLAPHIPQMVKNVAAALKVSEERINIKATTTEKLGFVGTEEGMSAYAVAMLRK